MSQDLQTLYSCPVCLQIPPDEIYQCDNKHLTCKDCFSRITECPQCRISLKGNSSRNKELESLLDTQLFPCPNAVFGCDSKLHRKLIPEHLENCRFKEDILQLCQLLGFNCDILSSSKAIKKLVGHLEENHGVVTVDRTTAVLSLEKFSEVPVNKTRVWKPLILREFLIIPKINGVQQTVSVVCIHLCETNDKADDYVVSFAIQTQAKGKNLKPLKWTTTVCSLAEAQSALQLPMFQIPGSVLQQFYTMGTHLQIQVIVEQASQQKPASQDLIELTNVVCLTTQLDGESTGNDDRDLDNYTSDDVNDGVACDGCEIRPLAGIRYNCLQCPDYDLCSKCRRSGKHGKHLFVEIQNDLERLAVAKLKYDQHLAKWKPLLSDDVIVESSQLCCECSLDDKRRAVLLCRACPKYYGVCMECFQEGRCQTKCENHPWMLTKELARVNTD